MNLYKVELINEKSEVWFKIFIEWNTRKEIEELCSIWNIFILILHINDLIEWKTKNEKIEILNELYIYDLLKYIQEDWVWKLLENHHKKNIKDFKVIISEDVEVSDLVYDLEYNE